MPKPAGASFKAADVVNRYIHRPPYPSQIYGHIVDLAPSTGRLLDLGCGEGKIARQMAHAFGQVVAVDPSANMIALGKTLGNGDAKNLTWVQATAEDAPLVGHFDVVTFASSIHWMDPVQLFPKLRKHLNNDHLLAFITGDAPADPAWQADWRRFLAKWVPEMTGQKLDSEVWRRSQTKHLEHIDIVQTREFISEPFTQTIEDFILCQHSRDTFTLPKLGSRRSEFQRDVDAILRPHANADGRLTFQVGTQVILATLKAL